MIGLKFGETAQHSQRRSNQIEQRRFEPCTCIHSLITATDVQVQPAKPRQDCVQKDLGQGPARGCSNAQRRILTGRIQPPVSSQDSKRRNALTAAPMWTALQSGPSLGCAPVVAVLGSCRNQRESTDSALLQLLVTALAVKGSTPSCCHGAAGSALGRVTHCLSLHQSRNAFQSSEPFSRVSGEPTTIRPRRGRVMPTLSRRRSLTKPMRPCLLHLQGAAAARQAQTLWSQHYLGWWLVRATSLHFVHPCSMDTASACGTPSNLLDIEWRKQLALSL